MNKYINNELFRIASSPRFGSKPLIWYPPEGKNFKCSANFSVKALLGCFLRKKYVIVYRRLSSDIIIRYL